METSKQERDRLISRLDQLINEKLNLLEENKELKRENDKLSKEYKILYNKVNSVKYLKFGPIKKRGKLSGIEDTRHQKYSHLTS